MLFFAVFRQQRVQYDDDNRTPVVELKCDTFEYTIKRPASSQHDMTHGRNANWENVSHNTAHNRTPISKIGHCTAFTCPGELVYLVIERLGVQYLI